MADTKISADVTVTPAGVDFVPIVQGGDNKKATLASVVGIAHASNHLSTGSDPIPTNNWHGVVITRPAAAGPLPANVTTTTFTLSALANPFDYYYQGVKKTVNTNRTVTIETSTGSGVSTAGLYHIYFNGSDVLTCASSFDPFADTGVYIANVYWNGSNYGIVSDERHAHDRDRAPNGHPWQHRYVGCRYGSGLDFAFAGTTNANTTFTISSGIIADEDIRFSIAQQTQCRLWYQTGASTYAFINTLSTLPYYAVSATPGAGIYAVRGDTYALVSITSSTRYFNYWVFATTSLTAPIHIFAETVTAGNVGGYTSVANARLIQPPNLSTFGLSAEWKLLHRVVVNGAGLVAAYVSANDDYRSSSSIPGGGTSVANHDATSPQLAAAGVTYGHIDDQAQTIAGAKTFTNGVVATVTGTASGNALTGAVTSSGLTQATNKLLGRGTASTGAIEEITLGTNLSLTGTTLNGPTAGLTISTKTSGFTAASGNIYQCDTSGGTIAVTLPTGVANAYMEFWDHDGTWGTNNVTITPASGEKINGQTANETLVLNVNNARVALAYADTTRGWQLDTGGLTGYNSPINATSATLLQPGQTAYITYSAATSVPLNITTVEGIYELNLAGDSSVTATGSAVTLTPNAGGLSAGVVDTAGFYIDTDRTAATGAQTASGYKWNDSFFYLGFYTLIQCTAKINTFTKSKSVIASSHGNTTTANHIQLQHIFGYWGDTSTAWTTLGTVTFPHAQTGTICIRRIL